MILLAFALGALILLEVEQHYSATLPLVVGICLVGSAYVVYLVLTGKV